MPDSHLHSCLEPLLNAVAGALNRPGISSSGLALPGSATGVLALPFLALGWYDMAPVAILFNCLLDSLNGVLTRRRGLTDAGGLPGVALDPLFCALVPFGSILADPPNSVPAGAWLLFAFIGTGSSSFASVALAARHQIVSPDYVHESLYYLGGLTEGMGTILLFVLCCLFSIHFTQLTWLFGASCWLTTVTRICNGYQTLKRVV